MRIKSDLDLLGKKVYYGFNIVLCKSEVLLRYIL